VLAAILASAQRQVNAEVESLWGQFGKVGFSTERLWFYQRSEGQIVPGRILPLTVEGGASSAPH
jgi:hypothetical protein